MSSAKKKVVPNSDLLAGFGDNKSVRDALRWLTRQYGRAKLRLVLEWLRTLRPMTHDQAAAALGEFWGQTYGRAEGKAKLGRLLLDMGLVQQ